MTIRIGHRLLNGLQEVSGKHGGGADEGLSIAQWSGLYGAAAINTSRSAIGMKLSPKIYTNIINIL